MYDYFFFLDSKKELSLFDRARSLESSQVSESGFSGEIVFLDKGGESFIV
jgi:hypothetical protein